MPVYLQCLYSLLNLDSVDMIVRKYQATENNCKNSKSNLIVQYTNNKSMESEPMNKRNLPKPNDKNNIANKFQNHNLLLIKFFP